jgi:hypothetical protein
VIVHVTITRPASWCEVREVTHTSPAPCIHPVRVVAGDRVVWVPCGRRLPRHGQCSGCRIRVVIDSDQLTLPILGTELVDR